MRERYTQTVLTFRITYVRGIVPAPPRLSINHFTLFKLSLHSAFVTQNTCIRKGFFNHNFYIHYHKRKNFFLSFFSFFVFFPFLCFFYKKYLERHTKTSDITLSNTSVTDRLNSALLCTCEINLKRNVFE